MTRKVCIRFSVTLAIPLLVSASTASAQVNIWESVGPEGGTILTFAADPSNPGTIYAAVEPTSIYRSTDAGKSWSRLGTFAHESSATLRALVVDPGTPSVLYAALGDRILRSADSGATWSERGESATQTDFRSLLAIGGSPSVLVATSFGQYEIPAVIQRSTDGGASWSSITPPDDESPLELVGSGAALYATTDRGVIKSSDAGASWRTSHAGLPSSYYIAIAAAPSSPSTLYVLDGDQLHRSTDGGTSWKLMGPVPTVPGGHILRTDAADATILYLLAANERGCCELSGLARSKDAGRSWSLLYDEISRGLRLSTLLVPITGGGDLLVGLVSGGVLASADGGETFTPANRGLRAVAVDFLATPARPFPLVYGANWNSIFAGHDDASRWTLRTITAPDPFREPQPLPTLRDLEVDPQDPQRLQGAAGWYLVRSTDAGATLETRFGPLCLNPESVAIAPSAPEIRYVSGGAGGGGFTLGCLEIGQYCGLRKSTDSGATWTCVESARFTGATAIEIDPLDPNIVYRVASGLARTTDGGVTWTTTSTEEDLDPTDIAIDPLNPFTLYVGTEGKGIWRSIDRGASWQPFAGVDQGLPDAPVIAVVPHPLDPRILYATFEGIGVYASLDRGLSFSRLHGQGPDPAAFTGAFAIDSQLPSRLYAGTHGASILRMTHEESSSCEPGERTLCLGGGRFKVQVRWRDFAGRTGPGRAVTLTDDSGYFWFFDSANLELVVKALDARPLNDRFWVFYGSLTNVEFQLVVTDTVTGEVNAYLNPERNFASRGDTAAFPRAEGTALRTAVSARPERSTVGGAAAVRAMAQRASGGPCAADEHTLCLGGGRFRAVVDWTDFRGGTGTGHARPLNQTTGTFWFFNEANVEIAIKVLDGRALNDHFWVFYGALSNVAYRLTVEDTSTGEVRTYVNPSGQFASRGDTAAFLDPIE